MITTNVCSKCRQEKPLSEFHYNVCKPCRVQDTLRWRAKNPTAPTKHAKAWYERNRETAKAARAKAKLANPERFKEYDRKTKEKHKDKIKVYQRLVSRKYILKRYGLTVEQYEALNEKQESKCAICLVPDKRLHVDHDHKTGKVRSLLCGTCNRALGLFKDNPSILRAAASYLELHNTS